MTPTTMGQPMVKVSLTIVILDFDQWNKPAAPSKGASASAASADVAPSKKMEAPNA
jgi:hypothetical protein